jgi:hypothetical protein
MVRHRIFDATTSTPKTSGRSSTPLAEIDYDGGRSRRSPAPSPPGGPAAPDRLRPLLPLPATTDDVAARPPARYRPRLRGGRRPRAPCACAPADRARPSSRPHPRRHHLPARAHGRPRHRRADRTCSTTAVAVRASTRDPPSSGETCPPTRPTAARARAVGPSPGHAHLRCCRTAGQALEAPRRGVRGELRGNRPRQAVRNYPPCSAGAARRQTLISTDERSSASHRARLAQ